MTFQNADGSFGSETSGQPVNVQVAASGATVTMTYRDRVLYINNAAAYAALTVLLPKGVQPGDTVELGFAFAISALTVEDGFGVLVLSAAVSPHVRIVLKYINNTIKWVYWA